MSATHARRRASTRSVPRGVGVLAVLGGLFLAGPLVALALRTPWSRVVPLLARAEVLAALRLSFVTATAALGVAVALGLPLAWVLARRDFPGRDLVRAIAVLPMVLPPVVGGVALLLAYGRRGAVGGVLESVAGVTIPFTTAGVVLAQAFVALPFLVVTAEAGFRALDPRLEEAAATLGAGRWTVLRRVTIPLAAPALGAGMALAWARALGEFGATITFAGNLPGRTQTLPLAVFLALETDPAAAYVMSALLLALCVVVLVALRGRLLARP